jgi:very-short-patch-repair endonuclease
MSALGAPRANEIVSAAIRLDTSNGEKPRRAGTYPAYMGGKCRHVDLALAELAELQHGVATRAQLAEIGISTRTVEAWARRGRLHRVHRGVFAVGRRRIDQNGRWLAAVLACGEGAVLSHASAAALWGLARPREPTDVTCSPNRARRAGIRAHEGALHASEHTERSSIRVTTIARTLFDYAEVVSFGELEKAWEEADRRNLLQLGAVEQVCQRGHGRRALKPIRQLLAEARAPREGRSPLETRFARFREHYRLPPASANVEVLGREVDVLWPGARLIVELDSWEHHGHRAAFEGDRARDPALLLAGYRTVRVTHRRLNREADALAAQIRGLLALGEQDAAARRN